MNRSFKLGHTFGLHVKARPTAVISALLIWLLVSLAGIKFFRLKPLKATSGGFLAMLLHFLAEWWHQFGHAQAAEQTGYPMQGMEFTGPLALSQYPENEGVLSADVHLQRALGGPIFSFMLALVSLLIAVALRPFGNAAILLPLFSFADNLLVFTIGALTPLGFTDGSTLLYWWRRRPAGGRLSIR